jgi:hypothetical protein
MNLYFRLNLFENENYNKLIDLPTGALSGTNLEGSGQNGLSTPVGKNYHQIYVQEVFFTSQNHLTCL